MAASQAFISTVTGSLDGKGRVCIPAQMRDALTAQGTAGVYLRPSIDDSSLHGFGDALMQRYIAQQAEFDPFLGSDVSPMADIMLSMSQLVPRDVNGRVRLPDEFIAHAGLKDQVVFSGHGDHFRIWEPSAHAAFLEQRLKQARELAQARAAQAAAARAAAAQNGGGQ